MDKNKIKSVKQRFGIVGDSPAINRAINIAYQVAPVDITVLVLGESGVGKEFFPKIIHSLSSRKHNKYIAVNCGAIPEGTIDSELFGHEKGAFTDAREARQGYFETANGGTIFLDEVAELPLATQIRLLRVLESGEFIKVGSSKVQKTDVRVVAATNANFEEKIQSGKFREDLYYRLSTVPIHVPPLRERKEDIYPLFRWFVVDFCEKNKIYPLIELTSDARELLETNRWSGNVRQLKNITEQMCIIEKERLITSDIIKKYLPSDNTSIPVLYQSPGVPGISPNVELTERDILYKVLFDMKKDINELRMLVNSILSSQQFSESDNSIIKKQFNNIDNNIISDINNLQDNYKKKEWGNIVNITQQNDTDDFFYNEAEPHEIHIEEESLLLADAEKAVIIKALKKHNGNRKNTAKELGISERTLYRKIKEYEIKE
ncbi:MAG: sigma-54 interaction domain-containing protein [Bacteroidales bacterium]